MSHIADLINSGNANATPARRTAHNNVTTWDGFTTASKTARIYRSVKRTQNRHLSFAADLVAFDEECENPETLEQMVRCSWSVYRVSPLWNVQYKKPGKSRRSQLDDTELSIATRQEYDEGALKRYARLIGGYLLKDQADWEDVPSRVEINPFKGLRGSRNDRDALKIEVFSQLGSKSRLDFTGVLCGVETQELQIVSSEATSLPLLLANGPVSLTERVVYGLQKCFDCIISPVEFSDGELKLVAAMYAGLDASPEEEKENSSVECTIQPPSGRRGKRKSSGDPVASQPLPARKRKLNIRKDLSLTYVLPVKYPPELRNKVKTFKFTMDADEVRHLWSCIHPTGESEFTDEEMRQFHSSLEAHIRACLGLRVDMLELVEVRLPIFSLNRQGRLKMELTHHVKLFLRYLSELCQGDMLAANPTLGTLSDSDDVFAS